MKARKKLREIEALELRSLQEGLAQNQLDKLSKKAELVLEVQRLGPLVPAEIRIDEPGFATFAPRVEVPVPEEEWTRVEKPKPEPKRAPAGLEPKLVPGMVADAPKARLPRSSKERTDSQADGWQSAQAGGRSRGSADLVAAPKVDPREHDLVGLGIEINQRVREALGVTTTLEQALEVIFS